MVASKKCWKDYVWLAWFGLQLVPILLVDGVHFYPSSWYEPPGSPLHFLQQLRSNYIASYNDPIVQWSPASATGHDSWIQLFLFVEMIFTLPTVVYALYRLGGRKDGTTGADELLFLVYAFETAFTTLVCIYDVFWWDDVLYPADMKRTFIVNLFGPWLAIPTLMFADMYSRILARFHAADAATGNKKTQ